MERPAVQRGRRVNSPRSDLPGMLRERHDASDFESQRGRQVDWVMRKKILRTTPSVPQRSASQATAVIGKAYRFAIANWLAERLKYDLSKDERERPLCEAGNRLVESPDIPVDTRKHHTALECSHDVKGSRFRFGAADPLC